MNLSHFLIAIFFLLNISYALRSSTSYSEDDYDPPEYRNYSARDGGYSYAPRGPSEYSTVFLQNATFATYDGDPFAWQFDHTQKSRRSYDQEVQNWVYANVQVAWSWAWAKWTAENGWLSDYGYTCGEFRFSFPSSELPVGCGGEFLLVEINFAFHRCSFWSN